MAFWWVNQNQTWRQEVGGGYMWSPKRRSDGASHEFYENMRRVDAGDLVFSFYQQRVRYIGVVQRPAVSAPQPEEFGQAGAQWSDDGWYVPVLWYPVEKPIQPRAIIDELRPTLPARYSPLQRETGNGLQNVYLASVPDGMAAVLFDHLGGDAQRVRQAATSQPATDGAVSRLEDEIEQRLQKDPTISDTERAAVVMARRGQGRFRRCRRRA
mgnify:FL=1